MISIPLLLILVVLWILAIINYRKFSGLIVEHDANDLVKICGKTDLTSFQYRRTKRTLGLLLLLIVTIGLQRKVTDIGLIVALCIFVYKAPYWQLKRTMNWYSHRLKYEFPIWLRQLQILLQNNTVVVSLEQSLPLAPKMIKEHLKQLIINCKENPQRMDIYTDFLHQYHCVEIQRAMKLLYRYNSVGQEDAMKQLNRMINTTGKWLREQRLASQSNYSQMIQWWGMLPLFGVTLVFLVMMMQTIVTLLERR